jgi:hypothetical protein
MSHAAFVLEIPCHPDEALAVIRDLKSLNNRDITVDFNERDNEFCKGCVMVKGTSLSFSYVKQPCNEYHGNEEPGIIICEYLYSDCSLERADQLLSAMILLIEAMKEYPRPFKSGCYAVTV